MIAVDTSSLIEYLSGGEGADVDAVETALEHKQAALPPVVLSELLSDPALSREVAGVLKELPLLSATPEKTRDRYQRERLSPCSD